MKKWTAIILSLFILLLILLILGYWVWYRNHPLISYGRKYQNRSEQSKVCEEKCRDLYRDDMKKCGENCFPGATVYAFEKKSNKCLYRADITKKNYYIDSYIKNCNTNEYITRWNPTPEEIEKNGAQVGITMKNNAHLLETLVGGQGEIFLLGQ